MAAATTDEETDEKRTDGSCQSRRGTWATMFEDVEKAIEGGRGWRGMRLDSRDERGAVEGDENGGETVLVVNVKTCRGKKKKEETMIIIQSRGESRDGGSQVTADGWSRDSKRHMPFLFNRD